MDEPDDINALLANLSVSDIPRAARVLVGWNPSDSRHALGQAHVEAPARTAGALKALQARFPNDPNVRFRSKWDPATAEEIRLSAGPEWRAELASTAAASPEDLDRIAAKYDSVYLAPGSFDVAKTSLGVCLGLLRSVCVEPQTAQSAFALVRPPGHHAGPDGPNGFCLLNNVVVTAKVALNEGRASRILIFDWDVHHGQGTQDAFYEDDRVLYISIHRFEGGRFWPHLRRSQSSAVGAGPGLGFTANLALAETGCGDSDYAALLYAAVLPLAIEFHPDLVLVSAGFDACRGDPKGLMGVTPPWFAQATALLRTLAGGRMLLILEGGYNVSAVAECVVSVVEVLSGLPPTPLPRLAAPKHSTMRALVEAVELVRATGRGRLLPDLAAIAAKLKLTLRLPKPAFVEVASGSAEDTTGRTLAADATPPPPFDSCRADLSTQTGVAWEETVTPRHRAYTEHPEQPLRTAAILRRLAADGLLAECRRLPALAADGHHLALAHSKNYVRRLQAQCGTGKLEEWSESRDCFLRPESFEAASIAAGGLRSLVHGVAVGRLRNAFAVLRPPGHHAERDASSGFCLFSNVALAAQSALDRRLASRVLILDWDVHHGNSTQDHFYDSSSVLFISLHRFGKHFFPGSGDADEIGGPKARGFNINIPWKMEDASDLDYQAAFCQLVLPLAASFAPDLILVSAGFDAAAGDPLGGFSVRAAAFGWMTSVLSALAHGRVVLALEGGYNPDSISAAASACLASLRGWRPDMCSPPPPMQAKTGPILADVIGRVSSYSPFLTALVKALR